MAVDKKDKTTGDLYADDRSVLSAGAALAAQRKIYQKKCSVCGAGFEGIKQKDTCSPRCRKAKSRAKLKAAKQEEALQSA